MRKLAILLLLLPLCGCSLLTSAFTSAHLGDLTIEGVATAACAPVSSAGLGTSSPPPDLLGDKPIGCLLGVSRVGETAPIWVYCSAGEQEKACAGVPANGRVKITGQPLGGGIVFYATHINVQGN